MSQITTHVLDTSKGKPAEGIEVILYQQSVDPVTSGWKEVALGATDSDGRILNLLDKDAKLETGIYKMKFNVQAYFEKQAAAGFYPVVEIIFQIRDAEHYHIPLLLNPFGYTTYRGS